MWFLVVFTLFDFLLLLFTATSPCFVSPCRCLEYKQHEFCGNCTMCLLDGESKYTGPVTFSSGAPTLLCPTTICSPIANRSTSICLSLSRSLPHSFTLEQIRLSEDGKLLGLGLVAEVENGCLCPYPMNCAVP